MPETISTAKKKLRKQILDARSAIPMPAHREKSGQIAARLSEMPPFQRAQIIASFSSFRGEVDTEAIHSHMRALGKTLVLPKVNAIDATLTFYIVEDLDTLVRGHYGILEPNPDVHPYVDYASIDCILTPGAVFDAEGFRIGYGGGYYDRLFEALPEAVPKIALAFDCQRVSKVPRDVFDYAVDFLVTEYKCYAFR